MCKYEMDPASIVEDTEQTPFCPQTDRQTWWTQCTPTPTGGGGGGGGGGGVIIRLDPSPEYLLSKYVAYL